MANLILEEMQQFRTAYGPKEKVKLETGEGLTKQASKDECDINVIVRKFNKTGIITHVREVQGEYLDVQSIDFQTAMNMVATANNLFAELPAHIRKEFRNDPAAFVDYATKPENLDGMREMGLAPPAPEPTTPRVPVDNPSPPPADPTPLP